MTLLHESTAKCKKLMPTAANNHGALTERFVNASSAYDSEHTSTPKETYS